MGKNVILSQFRQWLESQYIIDTVSPPPGPGPNCSLVQIFLAHALMVTGVAANLKLEPVLIDALRLPDDQIPYFKVVALLFLIVLVVKLLFRGEK